MNFYESITERLCHGDRNPDAAKNANENAEKFAEKFFADLERAWSMKGHMYKRPSDATVRANTLASVSKIGEAIRTNRDGSWDLCFAISFAEPREGAPQYVVDFEAHIVDKGPYGYLVSMEPENGGDSWTTLFAGNFSKRFSEWINLIPPLLPLLDCGAIRIVYPTRPPKVEAL